MIELQDFAKLEIRIGTVISVEKAKNADMLLLFTFDVGDETRQIVAGMAPFLGDLKVLKGRQFPLLLNIEPREFRGHKSHGMIIAADVDGKPVFLEPEKPIPAGAKVK